VAAAMQLSQRSSWAVRALIVVGVALTLQAQARSSGHAVSWLPALLPDTSIERMPTGTRVNGVELEIFVALSALPRSVWESHLEQEWRAFGADYRVQAMLDDVLVARRRFPWNETALMRSLPGGGTRLVFSRTNLAVVPTSAGCALGWPRQLQLRSAVASPRVSGSAGARLEQCWLVSRLPPRSVMVLLDDTWRAAGWLLARRQVDPLLGRASATWRRGVEERAVFASRSSRSTDIVVLGQATE